MSNALFTSAKDAWLKLFSNSRSLVLGSLIANALANLSSIEACAWPPVPPSTFSLSSTSFSPCPICCAEPVTFVPNPKGAPGAVTRPNPKPSANATPAVANQTDPFVVTAIPHFLPKTVQVKDYTKPTFASFPQFLLFLLN
jgi:hypothetical protein